MRRAGALALASLATLGAGLSLGGALGGPASGDGGAASAVRPRAERVLILSLPAVTWTQVNDLALPHLDALLDESAVGGLSTRGVVRRTAAGDGYATLSAGTRARGVPGVDGLAFEVGERYATEPADEVFTRRTGFPVTSGLFSLALKELQDRNAALPYDAEIGALGDALVAAGAEPAVIANADLLGEVNEEYGRQAVTALMTSTGVVSGGRAGTGLLDRDPDSPFGHRLANRVVVEEFDEVWTDRAAVLVEASDLVRADLYRAFAQPAQQARLFETALLRTDDLVGRLLRRVDPERDAVLVVGPYHSVASVHLTPAALRAPGLEPGVLRSAYTRRAGSVMLVDVAPTVLDLLGIERPDEMEGRRFERSHTGGTAEERREWLADVDEAAQWRDGVTDAVQAAYVVGQLVLWCAAVAALAWSPGRGRRIVERAALGVLAVLPFTYLAGLLPFHEWGAAPFWAYLLATGTVGGIVLHRVFRRWPADPLVVVLGTIYGVLVIDMVTGAHLQVNTVFGYTPTVAGRFAGLANLGFAQLAASATLLAGLLASRFPGRAGRAGALAVVGGALVIVASPFWGANVGATLTLVPTLAGVAVVLYAIRVRLRTVLLVGGAMATVFFTAGFIDLARPEESRSHLGRLFGDVQANGLDAFVTVVIRKVGANLAVLTSSAWFLMVPVVFAFVLYLIWRAPWRLSRLREAMPRERAGRVGFVIAAVCGFAFNDSGIAIPGLMLGVMNASLVYLVLRTEAPPWKAEVDRRLKAEATAGADPGPAPT